MVVEAVPVPASVPLPVPAPALSQAQLRLQQLVRGQVTLRGLPQRALPVLGQALVQVPGQAPMRAGVLRVRRVSVPAPEWGRARGPEQRRPGPGSPAALPLLFVQGWFARTQR